MNPREKARANLEEQLADQAAQRQDAECALINLTQQLGTAQERIAIVEAEQRRANCLLEELAASRQLASAEQKTQVCSLNTP